jgi:hypothetical protein
MRRAAFVVFAGLLGLLLGVGLSLAVDAIAGGHLSEPVPLRIQNDATTSGTPGASAPEDHQTTKHDGASATQTPSPTSSQGTVTTTTQTPNENPAGSDSGEGASGKDD